jgi:8-oxo-dGTP pyrophosphatase MutT (NUDIX family)/alpha-beta hydrolase superfamily lysophospholipase
VSEVHIDAKRYRRNVGVVVFNRDGKVWLGRRADGKGERIWQFPQGGVDKGEDLLEAARRELWEETGITTASLIGRAPGWITYDFPQGFTGSKVARGYAGQTQAWFAFRFEGEDSEIDLAHHQIEFDTWRWADLSEAPALVAPFKHEAYLKVIEAFGPIARGEPMPAGTRGAILMIHGVNCTGRAFDRLAADFRARGWTVEAPTLRADLRVAADPTPALGEVTLGDYVREAAGWAGALEARTGKKPVLFGHSMGGLIVQKLLEMDRGAAGVLITPASPADAGGGKPQLSTLFTFLNVLLTPNPEAKALKPWRTGFEWGVLNCVPKRRRDGLYAEAVYDSGRVYQALQAPESDPDRLGVIDERLIKAPILTLGAGRDRTTPLIAVKAVAAKYARIGGDFRAYPHNGHWIVDEPGTDRMVSDIDTWLTEKIG